MRNLFVTLVLLMSGVASAQSYLAVGSSFSKDNVGTFWMAGINTSEDNDVVVACDASLNFTSDHSFLRLSVMPQYDLGPIRVGAGFATYYSTKDFGYSGFTGSFSTKIEHSVNDGVAFFITTDYTRELGNLNHFGIKLNL